MTSGCPAKTKILNLVTLLNQLQSSRPTGAREKEPKKPNNAWNYRGQKKFGRKFTFKNNLGFN